jgi:hypothetical protein
MKEYGEVDVQIHGFLTSTPVGGEWSASRPCRFTTEKRAPPPRYPQDKRVGELQAGLDDMEKWFDPTGTQTPTSQSFSP